MAKKRKLGRPKSRTPNRTERLVLPVTPKEKALVEALAEGCPSVAEYMRERILPSAA